MQTAWIPPSVETRASARPYERDQRFDSNNRLRASVRQTDMDMDAEQSVPPSHDRGPAEPITCHKRLPFIATLALVFVRGVAV